MTHLPRSEWDRLLQSTIRLRNSVTVRIDSQAGYCLHEQRSGQSFGLAPWQTLILLGIEGERPFALIVREVVSEFPEMATPESIGAMLRGLIHHHLVETIRPVRPVSGKLKAVSQARKFSPWRRSEWSGLSRRMVGNVAICGVVAVGVWCFPQGGSPTSAAMTEAEFSTQPVGSLSMMAWASDSGVPVTASCRGVIIEVLVRDGDAVRSGDILALIADPVAQSTRDNLRRLMGECRVSRDGYYTKGDLVSYLRETKALARFASQLAEWELRSGPIALRAPVAGQIHQSFFAEGVGDPVKPGDVLMTIETDVMARSTDESAGLIAGLP